jgi:hypothetical protein
MRKLGPIQQWMADHPDDVPYPRSPEAAKAWRAKRGIGNTWQTETRRKYEAAMAEKRH